MNTPTATYRLQFRNGMDFARTADLVPYLARLGVSHLYASPLFQAVPGSTHGYDVTDHGRCDESLGGMDGFARLSTALKDSDLGLILDIVPNHMAASPHNPWWRDVLRHGRASAFAGHFDIDWTRPRLLLPVLGRSYHDALAGGEFALGYEADGLVWRYFDHAFPLDPDTWKLVLGDAAPPRAAPAELARWFAEGANSVRLRERLAAVSRDAAGLDRLHEAQPWRLAYWRAARDMLGYRRFFEISDLVGVRVEVAHVFADVHRFLFELIDSGHIDGIRVDHVDGLADPAGYLDRFRHEAPRSVPIWVEKILARDEPLPHEWPVAGTTGYEFADAVGCALTNSAATPTLDASYAAFTGVAHDYRRMMNAAKREVLTRNLAAELDTLLRLLDLALTEDSTAGDWGPDSLRRAIVAMLCAMPVYRTYLAPPAASQRDRAIIARAADAAREDPALDDPAVLDALAHCLLDDAGEAARAFRVRFQQTSGALMAKAVEDTLFYRYNRLIAANEVGGEPDVLGMSVAELHSRMQDRVNSQPAGLSATATHDTKRGEDARMRIAAISEDADAWADAVKQCEHVLGRDADLASVDAETRWLFYQAVLGSWVRRDNDNLAERVSMFLIKAAREAKKRTSWVKPDTGYEEAIVAFARQALAHEPFLRAFADTAEPFVRAGERKSLVQLALKLTLPGVPDVYQGTEFADLSLVDPDNRRPVDFERRLLKIEATTTEIASDFDERKFALLRFGLDLRRSKPDVFAGGYSPLAISAGPRVIAFAREGPSGLVLVAADLSGRSEVPEKAAPLAWPPIGLRYRLARSFPSDPEPNATTRHDFAAHLRSVGLSIALFVVD